jgi:hypothetical protein
MHSGARSHKVNRPTMRRCTGLPAAIKDFKPLGHYKGQTTCIENEGLPENSNWIAYKNLELDAKFWTGLQGTAEVRVFRKPTGGTTLVEEHAADYGVVTCGFCDL